MKKHIVQSILNQYKLDPKGLHGIGHWARVCWNGWEVAKDSKADTTVVEMFALFHDAGRQNDYHDPGHGQRGADLALELKSVLGLSESQFDLLYRACANHTNGTIYDETDETIRTCWDADRLEMSRLGVMIDTRYLCTISAKWPATIREAYQNGINQWIPKYIVKEWVDFF